GFIGVLSCVWCFSVFCVSFFPSLFFFTPLFAFLGGACAFFLVYIFSWKSGLDPLRMILIGVAINAVFTGLSELFNAQNASSMMSDVSVTTSTLSMKT